MAQLKPIAVSGKTLTPTHVDANGVAQFVDLTQSSAVATTASVLVRRPKLRSGVTKVTGRMASPFIYTLALDSTKKASEVLRGEINIMIPANATPAQRKEFFDTFKAFIQTTEFTASVEKLESLF